MDHEIIRYTVDRALEAGKRVAREGIPFPVTRRDGPAQSSGVYEGNERHAEALVSALLQFMQNLGYDSNTLARFRGAMRHWCRTHRTHRTFVRFFGGQVQRFFGPGDRSSCPWRYRWFPIQIGTVRSCGGSRNVLHRTVWRALRSWMRAQGQASLQ